MVPLLGTGGINVPVLRQRMYGLLERLLRVAGQEGNINVGNELRRDRRPCTTPIRYLPTPSATMSGGCAARFPIRCWWRICYARARAPRPVNWRFISLAPSPVVGTPSRLGLPPQHQRGARGRLVPVQSPLAKASSIMPKSRPCHAAHAQRHLGAHDAGRSARSKLHSSACSRVGSVATSKTS